MQIVVEHSRKDIHNSDIPVVCAACEARHGGVCGTLTASQLTELSRHAARRRVEPGSEMIGQGEAANNYANIIRGVVKLSKMLSDGRQQIVGLQFAPDFMGRPFMRESALSAEAATDTDVCAFPRAVIERLVGEAPGLEHRLHEQALKELDEARDWMLTLGRKTAQEKVASFLYLIATHVDPENGVAKEFDLPLSRADIADYLGLTIETVSRQITKLRKEGVIRVENSRRVIVPDGRRLMRHAGIDC
ncbi:transcriptional regulator [Sinorhizobium fredii USDA 205]|uniref:Crp/Fnr family transcriptional regulator n=1 Tax=Rhizobium fredii TaxID=380 RepID=A0A2A6M3Y5_RHIFR|nr:Crp/Fnr family transcriptional regulator [Sinorhizobium fredii]KSV90991.1 transcriptional regulator [Sinorhizobium fredii USDA 205]MCG5475991.1 Crp/Fnr family transcriptional regulator [Sinorhizobium fredii]MQW98532.1 helix-turn-helix domain-containing protein [Sinorhizobium fredii]MQX08537.1 helix-turn-helix domain-containing protein [Sinorhizobium fredii]PDT49375.1 Crp/Fnr family transcriptional regulator [Sinorhizobium fredii]